MLIDELGDLIDYRPSIIDHRLSIIKCKYWIGDKCFTPENYYNIFSDHKGCF